MIKNLAPLKFEKYTLAKFEAKATAAQKKAARRFCDGHWLVEAVRHINKRDWFLTFKRSVHVVDGGTCQSCHVEGFTVRLNKLGQTKTYRRLCNEVIMSNHKLQVERLIEKCVELRDQAHDDEFVDELDNAIIHLEAASDRLIHLEEEEAEDDGKDWVGYAEHDRDEAYDAMRDTELTD